MLCVSDMISSTMLLVRRCNHNEVRRILECSKRSSSMEAGKLQVSVSSFVLDSISRIQPRAHQNIRSSLRVSTYPILVDVALV